MTVRQALANTQLALNDCSDAPSIDAERLLLHALAHGEATWLYAHGEEQLTAAEAAQLAALVRRRQTGEPLAYLLGQWEFYGRPFFVTPAVLIPRPSTEALVDAALRYMRLPSTLRNIEDSNRQMVVTDIGTGSGCIAVTLALEFSIKNLELSIIATDISAGALEVARRNAERHGVAREIEFIQGNLFEPLRGRYVDLIISNPPYVPSAEIDGAGNKQETRGLLFEPRQALDGGPDGQRVVRRLRRSRVPLIIETYSGRILNSAEIKKGWGSIVIQ